MIQKRARFELIPVVLVTTMILLLGLWIALMLWARALGIYGLNLIAISNANNIVTDCSGFQSNGAYGIGQGGPLELAAALNTANQNATQKSEESDGRNLTQSIRDLAGGKELDPFTLTALYACVLRDSGIPARVTILLKTPLRSQHLLLAEYKEGGRWKAIEVTRGIGFALDGQQISALEIIRSFYRIDFQRIVSLTPGEKPGDNVTGKVGISALHKAHFAVYLDRISLPVWRRLPVVRAFVGPVGYVDAQSFDGHLEDLDLYRFLYRCMHVYVPITLLVMAAIAVFSVLVWRRNHTS